jgi:hypothetical protein
MKVTFLPDKFLSKMGAADRKALGISLGRVLLTSAEAMAAYDRRVENDLRKEIFALLSLRGIWWATSRSDKRATLTKGTPDVLFCYRGKAMAWELKAAIGKCTLEQEETHAHMRRDGWRVDVIRSVEQARGLLVI